MQKILIIGGSGFIGHNLCRYLSQFDYEVTSFDIMVPLQRLSGVKYISGDFFDDSVLEEITIDKDCVIHALSTINPGNSEERYMQGYEKDFLQTIKLCRVLSRKNIRMIFLSSGGTVYGNQDIQPLNESVLPQPINHYGNVKLCIENTLRTFSYQVKADMISARISNPYGPGQDFHKGVGFIDAALKKAMAEEPIEVWGDGENIRDYIYIEDVCRMLMALVEYEGRYHTFNISSCIGTSQNGIIQIIKSMGLSPQIIYKEQRSVDVRKIILDNRRILNVAGGKVKNLQEGIELYYGYLKAKREN